MNKYKKYFIFFLVQVFLLVFLDLSYAANKPLKTSPANEAEEKACSVIKDKIQKTENISRYVKTSIQMGFNACGIIKCSIEGGGDLTQIITGAVEAGTTPDVVSRCAMNAGAEAEKVAEILNKLSSAGICYVLPEIPEKYDHPGTPVIVKPPTISPSGF